MKRIFVGIPILDHIHLGFAQNLRQEKNIRWILPKNLHVTLAPPWYEKDINGIINRLKKVKANPFEITFNKISFGPNPKAPRLIWASGKAPEEIIKLKTSIEQVLSKQPEDRKFQMHATLARFKAEDFKKFGIHQLEETVSWRQKAEKFALYESHLSPQGADYEILEEFY